MKPEWTTRLEPELTRQYRCEELHFACFEPPTWSKHRTAISLGIPECELHFAALAGDGEPFACINQPQSTRNVKQWLRIACKTASDCQAWIHLTCDTAAQVAYRPDDGRPATLMVSISTLDRPPTPRQRPKSAASAPSAITPTLRQRAATPPRPAAPPLPPYPPRGASGGAEAAPHRSTTYPRLRLRSALGCAPPAAASGGQPNLPSNDARATRNGGPSMFFVLTSIRGICATIRHVLGELLAMGYLRGNSPSHGAPCPTFLRPSRSIQSNETLGA
jgi:hypothetical protein